MKLSYILLSFAFVAVHAAPKSKSKSTKSTKSKAQQLAPAPGIKGMDFSHNQVGVDWAKVKASGVVFVYLKATDGKSVDPTFKDKYAASGAVGFFRGAYHFARPGSGSGADQAKFFIAHGGGWKADGRTLPGTVDFEAPPPHWTPPGACYNLSAAAMVQWIADFVNTYHAATGRYPVIYTSTGWWTMCTGNSLAFGAKSPLWLARFRAKTIGPLPAGWRSATFWQYDEGNKNIGDPDVYLGDPVGLQRLAKSG